MSLIFTLGSKQYHLLYFYNILWNQCYSLSRLLINRGYRNSTLTNFKCNQDSKHQDDSATYQSIISTQFKSSHYILDKSLAKSVVRVILKNQSSQNTPILEINAGPGVLTKELFREGVRNVVATDSREQLLPILERNLRDEISQHKLRCFHWDCFNLWRRDSNNSNFDKEYRDKEMEIVALLQQMTLGDEHPVTAFGVVSYVKERSFFNYLLHNFGFLEGIFSLRRLEWFLFVSAKIYKTVLASIDHDKSVLAYNKMSVLLHLLFDVKCHMEVSGQNFSPTFQNIKIKKPELVIGDQLVNYDMKYLLQLTPKKNWDSVLSALEIYKFSLFLRQLFHKKRMRLIPKMEQLIPGCGLHLIVAGYTMIQEVGKTSPEQFLQIYKDMQTWPEYHDSGLHYYLTEHAVHGMEEEVEGGDSGGEKSSALEETS